VIVNFFKNQKAEDLGKELYDVLDEVFDAEFGDEASEHIEKELVPFINRVMVGFSKRLDEKTGVVVNRNN
jgi:hypothetical protein